MILRFVISSALLISTMFGFAGECSANPIFTTDYFNRGIIKSWKPYIPEFENKPNQYCLEIGSWEGQSSLYIAKKFCNGEGSHLICIDTWKGSREHQHNENLTTLYERFLSNTKSYRDSGKIIPYQGMSKDVLMDLNYQLGKGSIKKFNFIYIDGSHDAKDVLVDAVLAWELLEVGGIMIFDDYEWGSIDHLSPKRAIKSFLKSYKSMYEVLNKGWQMHIRKISDFPH